VSAEDFEPTDRSAASFDSGQSPFFSLARDGSLLVAFRTRDCIRQRAETTAEPARFCRSAMPPALSGLAPAAALKPLAAALRENGRIERTLFTLEWLQSPELSRRVTIGLNKGESHHTLFGTREKLPGYAHGE